jgi:hypothetical protein
MAFCQGIFRKLPSKVNNVITTKTLFFAYFIQIKKSVIIMFPQTKCTEKPNKNFISIDKLYNYVAPYGEILMIAFIAVILFLFMLK